MAVLSVTELKARCLAVLAEVARTGESVTILKRGRPLARILPAGNDTADYPQKALAGKLEIVGDVISPVLPPEAWVAENSSAEPQARGEPEWTESSRAGRYSSAEPKARGEQPAVRRVEPRSSETRGARSPGRSTEAAGRSQQPAARRDELRSSEPRGARDQ